MTQDTHLNKLLATLYSAPLQSELWLDLLRDIVQLVHAEQAALLTHNMNADEHHVLGALGQGVIEGSVPYEAYYGKLDEWRIRGIHLCPKGAVRLGSEVWLRSEMPNSEFYESIVRPFRLSNVATIIAENRMPLLEHLTVYCDPEEETVDPVTLQLLRFLSPHLQTALYTRRKLLTLQSRIHDLESSLDHLATAVALFDSTGKVVFVNRAARQILDQRDGLSLEKRRLAAQSLTENTRLREILIKAVSAALGKSTANPGAMRISRLTRRPLHLTCAPMRSENSASFPLPGKAVAILFLTDPDHTPAPPAETLRILFQLTPAESRIAIALLHGQSPQQIADTHQVNRETIRTQLKSLFQKTGTHRQSDLIRLLASLHPTPAVDPS